MDTIVCSEESLSWDGILCLRCRAAFDDLIVPESDGPNENDFDGFVGRANYTDRRLTLFKHDYPSFNRCAMMACQLCAKVLKRSKKLPETPDWLQRSKTAMSEVEMHAELVITVRGTHTVSFMYCDPSPAPGKHDLRLCMVEFQPVYDDDFLPLDPVRSESTSSNETLQRILTWSRLCSARHERCTKWSTVSGIQRTLPTRLLSFSLDPKDHAVRLILGQQLDMETPYMTLSHCWGGDLAMKLTLDNVDQLSREVPWEQLPRTFKEAIIVTKSLHVTYLWIDALCIIQDSESDWMFEAGRMTQVYANSFLNISADESKNSDSGLFRQRDPTVHQSFTIPSVALDNNLRGYCCYERTWQFAVDWAPLNKRAWVVQECFLSPRIVHFAYEEVCWECSSCMTMESLPVYLNVDLLEFQRIKGSAATFDSNLHSSTSEQRLYDMWFQLAGTYSACDLSVLSDKPVAIAGLAKAFCHYLGLEATDYVGGLWRPTFIHDLKWSFADFDTPSSPVASPSTPSWSWLRVAGGMFRSPKDRGYYSVAELVKVETTPIGDPFGPVASGFATIRAPMCVATLQVFKIPGDISRHIWITINDFSFSNAQETSTNIVFVNRDGDDAKALLKGPDNTISFALLAVSGRVFESDLRKRGSWSWPAINEEALLNSGGSQYCDFLILTRSDNPGEFRRLGLMSLLANNTLSGQREEFLHLWTALEQGFHSRNLPRHLYEEVDDRDFYTITLV